MTTHERAHALAKRFRQVYPDAHCELDFKNPLQLLIATILSAQCTDRRVNMVTPGLFKKYRDARAFAQAKAAKFESEIRSTGFFRSKTKSILGACQAIVAKHQGKVPDTMEELCALPGVGRKTANVITSVIDQQPNMAVDTHVYRVSRRIGLVPQSASTPYAVETELVKNIPVEMIHKAHHWLILHGRYICVARNPKCGECGLRPACHYYNTKVKPALASTNRVK